MTPHVRTIPAWFGLLALSALSCSDGGPTAGTLFVHLTTPSSDDGAVWVRLSGEAAASSSTSSGYSVFSAATGADTLAVVVVGDIVGGELFGFNVPDVEREYSAEVVQVARRDNALREPPIGYTVEVHR